MNTLEFLQAILPEQGVFYMGVLRDGRHGMQHRVSVDLPTLAANIIGFSKRSDCAVYHACATYREQFIEVDVRGTVKKQMRVAQNAMSAKAFWCDVDVGEEKAAAGKGYASKKDALAAVIGFCREHHFYSPLVVDSGNGLHFYWLLDEAIPAADWQHIASQFKAALAHCGVLADPSRTADIASVLRPVGSVNRKDPANPKNVVMRVNGVAHPLGDFLAPLTELVTNENIEVHAPITQQAVVPGLNDDLMVHAYPDVDVNADLVASKCQQVHAIIDKQGVLGYEHWRGVIGITVHCVDGRTKAHEWSSLAGTHGYTEFGCNQRFDSWNSGPTTCTFFETNNPGGCDGCQFKGKIKSPIVLGRVEPEPRQETTEEVIVEGETTPVLADLPAEIRGFQWDPGTEQMVRYMTNKEGTLEMFPFSRFHLYPTARVCQPDGTFQVRMRMHMPKRVLREFDVPSYVVALGGAELKKELGKYEFVPTDNKDADVHLTAYMRNALNRLVQTTEQMNTMTAFGWKDDKRSFLIGDRLYKNDGTTHKVVLGGAALSQSKAFPTPTGGAKGWSDGVNFLYNRENMQALQYALCSGFGSLLTPFGESQYFGIPVALSSTGSGKGKTTVCRTAMYAFGDANLLTINGKGGMTDNARSGLMSAYNNLPMLVDEITHIKDEDLSKLLYAASNGKDKWRMQSKQGQGVVLAETGTWAMSMYMTANRHLTMVLAATQGNTMAEAARVFEIRLDNYPPPELDAIEVGVANSKIERNKGAAGAAFIQWCVTHVDEIEDRFLAMTKLLVEDSAFAGNQTYRFYRQHAVCTLVAAQIMRDLNLVDFDLEALHNFVVGHIDRMCRDAIEYNDVSSDEAITQMINALGPRIITTRECRDLRHDIRGPEDFVRVNGEVAGRYIMGDAQGKEPLAGHLYIVKKEVRAWCLKNRVDYDAMIAEANNRGWLIGSGEEKFYIGRGTTLTNPQIRCVAFNMAAMTGAAGTAKFQLHSVVSGEKEA